MSAELTRHARGRLERASMAVNPSTALGLSVLLCRLGGSSTIRKVRCMELDRGHDVDIWGGALARLVITSTTNNIHIVHK